MQGLVLLTDAVVLLGTALVVAWMFRILKAPSIIGFLFTGFVIGPSGLAAITEQEVDTLVQLGIVPLMFTIGLELSPRQLGGAGRGLAVATGIQIAVTVGLTVAATVLFMDVGTLEAIILGVIVSNCSTAIILKQLSDRGQAGTLVGRITTGVSLFQDIFLLVFMLFLPIIALGGAADWQARLTPTFAGLAGLAVIVVFGRRLLSVFLQRIVLPGGQEFITLFAVLMACAGAWLAALVGWSMPLGAFIVGLLLAEADARHQIAADILPFRDVFNALFFISVGMLAGVDIVIDHFWLLGGLVLITLAGKSAIMTASLRICRWPLRPALHIGLGLGTVSEFGYVLAREAHQLGLLPEEVLNFVTVYALGTMLLGAMLAPIAGPLSSVLTRVIEPGLEGPEASPETRNRRYHVIVVGYGVNGQNVARVLQATHIPFCTIEMNPRLISKARESGVPIVMGDASRPAILHQAGLEFAHAMVVAINDPSATARVVARARAARPDMYILARTRFDSELDHLYKLGADKVISEDFETSIEIAANILKEMNIPDNVVEGQIAAVRAGRYSMLRGMPTDRVATEELMKVLQLTATRTHYLSEGAAACGKSIAELDLRAVTGATIIAVVRDGKPTTSPPPSFVLEAGDVLVLVGAHVQLEAAKAELERPEERTEETAGQKV